MSTHLLLQICYTFVIKFYIIIYKTESSEEVVEESKEKVEEVVEAQTSAEEQEASTTESFEITSPIHQQSNQQNDDFQVNFVK